MILLWFKINSVVLSVQNLNAQGRHFRRELALPQDVSLRELWQYALKLALKDLEVVVKVNFYSVT